MIECATLQSGPGPVRKWGQWFHLAGKRMMHQPDGSCCCWASASFKDPDCASSSQTQGTSVVEVCPPQLYGIVLLCNNGTLIRHNNINKTAAPTQPCHWATLAVIASKSCWPSHTTKQLDFTNSSDPQDEIASLYVCVLLCSHSDYNLGRVAQQTTWKRKKPHAAKQMLLLEIRAVHLPGICDPTESN